ncbi:MAG TPA: phage holin family protein [Candidatus Limnocylindrales bacterium]|nr:phage holin family protein [Candidatus Limnocylindrales bacterium]
MTLLRRLVAFWTLQVDVLASWRPGRSALVRRALLSWLLGGLSLLLVDRLVAGFFVPDVPTAFLGALVIALLNALVRPVLVLLTLPFTVLSAGLLSLALNAVVVLLAQPLVPGLQVNGFAPALAAALVITIVQTLVGVALSLTDDETFYPQLIRRLLAREADLEDPERTGLLIVVIDGLSAPVLRNAIRMGLAPHLSQRIRDGSDRLVAWDSGLPSQTSAVQAGLLWGHNDAIPAFRWYEKEPGRLMVSNRPADAAEIERRVSDGRGLLAPDGTSISTLLSGDAATADLTVSRFADPGRAFQPWSFYSYFLNPYGFARGFVLFLAEVVKELYQAFRQRRYDVRPRVDRFGPFPLLRAATNVLIRDLNVAFVVEALYRGSPVILVDFVDYDELAHHAGPERLESLRAVEGLDRVLRSLERAAAGAPRPYRIVVLSDHGQSQGATFRQRYGITLEALVRELMQGDVTLVAATGRGETWGPVNMFLTQLTRSAGFGGRAAARSLRRRTRDGYVAFGPAAGDEARRGAAATARGEAVGPAGERPELVVAASGNLGLVYFPDQPGRVTLEDIDERHPGLVGALANHPGIGFALVRSAQHGSIAVGTNGIRFLADDRVEGVDPLAPFGSRAADHLRRLDSFPNCADIVVNSMYDPSLDEVAAFEELVGSHGGLGGPQTTPFLLFPAEWPLDDPDLVGAPALHRQLRRWLDRLEHREATPGSPSSAEPSAENDDAVRDAADEPGDDRERDRQDRRRQPDPPGLSPGRDGECDDEQDERGLGERDGDRPVVGEERGDERVRLGVRADAPDHGDERPEIEQLRGDDGQEGEHHDRSSRGS